MHLLICRSLQELFKWLEPFLKYHAYLVLCICVVLYSFQFCSLLSLLQMSEILNMRLNLRIRWSNKCKFLKSLDKLIFVNCHYPHVYSFCKYSISSLLDSLPKALFRPGYLPNFSITAWWSFANLTPPL